MDNDLMTNHILDSPLMDDYDILPPMPYQQKTELSKGAPSADTDREKTEKLPSLLDPQPVIRVIVGKEKAEFCVHKDFLCHYSRYFAGALRDGAFKESESQTVELDHISVESFGLLVSWLYTQSIPIIHGSKDNANADRPSWKALTDLWIGCDYLQIPQLQNFVVDELLLKFNRVLVHPPQTLLSDIYENTCSGSMLRKLIVDLCVWRGYGDSDLYLTTADLYPKEMLLEIAVAFNKRLFGSVIAPISPLKDSTNYHVKRADGKK